MTMYLGLGILGVAAMLAIPALAFDNPDRPFAHPEWAQWFADQTVPDGSGRSCCNQSDGHILDDEDVRIVDGQYEVHTEEGWLRFPNTGFGQPGNTVLGASQNPTGRGVAWWTPGRAYCIAPPTGS